MLNLTSTTPYPATGPYAAFLKYLAARAQRHAVYRQTHSELTTLTDRELADLGLSRCDIPRVSTEAAQQA